METPRDELTRLLAEQAADRAARKGYDAKRASRIRRLETQVRKESA